MALDIPGDKHLHDAWEEAYDLLWASEEQRRDWSEALEDVERKYKAWLRSFQKRCLACGLEIPHTLKECFERRALINDLFAASQKQPRGT